MSEVLQNVFKQRAKTVIRSLPRTAWQDSDQYATHKKAGVPSSAGTGGT